MFAKSRLPKSLLLLSTWIALRWISDLLGESVSVSIMNRNDPGER